MRLNRTSFLNRLRHSTCGVAMTEFALALPLLLTAGLYGAEVANLTLTHFKISQIATHVADNASRIGDTSNLDNRKIYESDLNDLLLGAGVQAGNGIDLYGRGRVIISSLEVVPGTEDQQYIHWQRCRGAKVHPSSYGDEGDGLTSTIPGMGPAGEEIVALKGEAVIFVEVAYDYDPIVSLAFIPNAQVHAISSFSVRDPRDLTQIYQQNPGSPDPVSSCS